MDTYGLLNHRPITYDVTVIVKRHRSHVPFARRSIRSLTATAMSPVMGLWFKNHR